MMTPTTKEGEEYVEGTDWDIPQDDSDWAPSPSAVRALRGLELYMSSSPNKDDAVVVSTQPARVPTAPVIIQPQHSSVLVDSSKAPTVFGFESLTLFAFPTPKISLFSPSLPAQTATTTTTTTETRDDELDDIVAGKNESTDSSVEHSEASKRNDPSSTNTTIHAIKSGPAPETATVTTNEEASNSVHLSHIASDTIATISNDAHQVGGCDPFSVLRSGLVVMTKYLETMEDAMQQRIVDAERRARAERESSRCRQQIQSQQEPTTRSATSTTAEDRDTPMDHALDDEDNEESLQLVIDATVSSMGDTFKEYIKPRLMEQEQASSKEARRVRQGGKRCVTRTRSKHSKDDVVSPAVVVTRVRSKSRSQSLQRKKILGLGRTRSTKSHPYPSPVDEPKPVAMRRGRSTNRKPAADMVILEAESVERGGRSKSKSKLTPTERSKSQTKRSKSRAATATSRSKSRKRTTASKSRPTTTKRTQPSERLGKSPSGKSHTATNRSSNQRHFATTKQEISNVSSSKRQFQKNMSRARSKSRQRKTSTTKQNEKTSGADKVIAANRKSKTGPSQTKRTLSEDNFVANQGVEMVTFKGERGGNGLMILSKSATLQAKAPKSTKGKKVTKMRSSKQPTATTKLSRSARWGFHGTSSNKNKE